MRPVHQFSLTARSQMLVSTLKSFFLILQFYAVWQSSQLRLYFTAELCVISLALRTLYPLQVGSSRVYFEDHLASYPLVKHILIWLILCRRRGHTISFCWIPAHLLI